MRGGGHSVYGQSLAERGIVIDSRPLGKARMAGRTIEVEAGASLLQLARTAHAADSSLPVMSPCTMLSVGGFLSVGGESLGTRRHGAFVDQVAELDVVTGGGRLITCSAEREPELFSMMLAGMGQCGIIVRARLWVLPAPSQVATVTLTYESLEQFLHDQIRLATDLRFDHVSGQILPGPGGSWRCVTTVATLGQKARAPDPGQWLKEYSADQISDLSRLSYRDYILPGAKSGDPAPDSSPPHAEPAPPHRPAAQPSLAVWLPAKAGHELIRVLLATPRLTAGVTSILCRALPTGVFHRPLFRVPAEETMFAFWLGRAVGEHGPTLESQLDANQTFLDGALALGARRYPPYGGPAKPAQWRQHYGVDLYRRFAAAKRRYDPQRVLTPGAEMF
jgi:cytokinin dehydrogenase